MSTFDVFEGNGAVRDHTSTHCIIKVLVVQVTHHSYLPSHLIGPFILTLGKTFPYLLQCVDQDNFVVEHSVEIKSCRALPKEGLPIRLHHHKVLPLGVISYGIIFSDLD